MRDAEADKRLALLRQQTVLARFGEFAFRSNDLDEILTEACRLVGDALNTDLAKVMELQKDGQTLLVRAGVGWKAGFVGRVTVRLKDDTSEGYALKTGQPMVSPDIAHETRFEYPPFLTAHGVKAIANVLIIGHQSTPFGILQVDSCRPRSFDDDDTTFLRNYANLLAAAVDRLNSVEEARNEHERLRLALEAGELGSWELDPASGVMTCSHRFGVIFGYDTTLPVWTCNILMMHVVPEDREPVDSAFKRIVAAPAEVELRCECRICRASDSGIRWIELQGRSIPIRGVEKAKRLLGVVADITERRLFEDLLRHSNEMLETKIAERTRALNETNARLLAEASQREKVEEALRQSQKMEAVGQLTGGIAHDFNNMLHAIGGSLELISRRLELGRPAEASSLIDNARQTVERATALTNRLLSFARRQILLSRSIAPGALIHGMIDLIQRTVGPGIVVEEQDRAGDWVALCDPNQLETAVLNIAINARDAMPDGGRITICTRNVDLSASEVADQEGAKPGEYVEIAISDTGAGMDEATRLRAFEPFFTTKPVGRGTGLGLSQLYGFIRQSGGVVRLDAAPGQGTAVRLYLARHKPARTKKTPPVAETGQAAVAGSTIVLLVDDEVQMRAVIREALQGMHWNVLEVLDGPMALKVFHDEVRRVDLLVTEVDLPGVLNGWQLADALRATKPDLPVLFVTADVDNVSRKQLAAGMEMIVKPFALSALTAKVRGLMEVAP